MHSDSRHTVRTTATHLLAVLALLAATAPEAIAQTYYWDTNGTASGFGSATGTWDTAGNSTWNTVADGTTGPIISTSTTTSTNINFGNGATGLGAGTISVGTVDAGNLTFASGSGAIVLSGGTINLAATSTITVNNATNTISSQISGAGTSLTKAGSGILVLSGANSYTGTTIVNTGTLQGTTSSTSLTPPSPFSTSTLELNGGILQLRASGTVNTTAETIVFGNNVTVGGNTTINVDRPGATSGSKTIQLGTLSIGANTLNVTGGNSYGLRFNGATTLTGNAIFNPTTASLTLAGAIGDAGSGFSLTKNGSGTLIFTNTSNNTFSGGFNISGGVVSVDSTTNANAFGAASNVITFTGNATIHNTNLSYTIGQAVVVNNGVIATFRGANQENTIVNGVVSGSGEIRIQSDSNTTAASFANTANTHTGTLWVGSSGGNALNFTANSLADSSTGTLKLGSSTATINFTLGAATSAPVTLTNRAVELAGTTGAISLNNDASSPANVFTIAPNLTFTTVNSGDKTLTLGGTNTGANAFNGSIGNNGTSTTGITKAGAGTWVISGANIYTGKTTISGGTLSINSIKDVSGGASALGNPTTVANGTIDINGGVLTYTGGAQETDRVINLAGTTGSATLNNQGTGLLKFTTSFTATGVGSKTLVLTGGSGTIAEIAGAIVDNGGTNRTLLTRNGANSTWTLSGANTYSGANSINAGTLVGTQTSGTPFGTGAMTIGSTGQGQAAGISLAPTGSGSAISLTGGTLASGTLFTYAAGATLSLNKGSQTSLTYTFGGGGNTTGRGTNGTLILSTSDITNFGTAGGKTERFIMNGTAPTQVNTLVSGVVIQDRSNSDAGDFAAYNATDGYTKAGYTHTNFTGSTNTSLVEITTGTATGTISAYAVKVSGVTVTNSGTLTLGSSGNPVAGLILNGGTINGGILTTPTSSATEFGIYTSGTSVISSSINTATTQAGVSVFGPGTLDLSGSTGNSFTGGLRINGSTVIATNNNQLGGTTSSITLLGGTLQTTGTFALGGAAQRSIFLGTGQNETGGTFNVTSGITTYQNASGKIISNLGSAAATLTKTGNGTLILSGNTANTYTGGTFVNGGTLLANASGGSSTGTGNVTVGGATASGTPTLGGTGTISGRVTVSGTGAAGTISGGTGTTGTLTIGNGLTLQSGSKVAVGLSENSMTGTIGGGQSTLSSASNNSLSITGTTTIHSGTNFIISNATGSPTSFTPGQTYSYVIMTGAGNQSTLDISSITSPGQFTFENFDNSDQFAFSITGNSGGSVFLNIAPVPEPAAVLGIAIAALGLGQLVRRRKVVAAAKADTATTSV